MNLKFCCSLLQTSELLSPSIYRGCLWVWRDDQVKSTHAGFFLDTSFPFTPHATVGSPSNYSAKLSPNAVSARPAFLFIPRQIIFRSFSPCLAPRARNSLPSLFTARNFQPFLFHHAWHRARNSLFFSFSYSLQISFAARVQRQTSLRLAWSIYMIAGSLHHSISLCLSFMLY